MKQYTLPCIHQFWGGAGQIGIYFVYTHPIYIAILNSDCVIPEAPVRRALCYIPLTRYNYSVVSASARQHCSPALVLNSL